MESSILPGIKAVNIDNGIPFTCNNILIFPSLDYYEIAIEKLDLKIDEYNDSFDLQTMGMTDTEADDYADLTVFNEEHITRQKEMFTELE